MAPLSIQDLKRIDLFRSSDYINAQWVNAESGKAFVVPELRPNMRNRKSHHGSEGRL